MLRRAHLMNAVAARNGPAAVAMLPRRLHGLGGRAALARPALEDAITPRRAVSPSSSSSSSSRARLPLLLARAAAGSAEQQQLLLMPGANQKQPSTVYKFGGSSVRDAERMREVADIVCEVEPHEWPVVVLSAMGKTTNLLLEAGELAVLRASASALPPLQQIRNLHLETCDTLGVDASAKAEVEALLSQLEQLLVGVAILQDLTPRAKDQIVSFGERLSTRIFAAYLRSRGVAARQHDAFDLITTTDDFGNGDVIYEETTPKVRAALLGEGVGGVGSHMREIPIVTGFLGRGVNTRAITTLGRGGSDLSATVIGWALRVKTVIVWKDVNGVLTTDPRIVASASPVEALTFEEATELAFFGAQVLHPLAMQPAVRSRGAMSVSVRNSYNRGASGTTITAERDMHDSLVTSIVLKRNATLLDVSSPSMVGQYGFLAAVFDVFRRTRVSVDVVATSEVSVSVSLDPKRAQWDEEEVGEELAALTYELEKGLASASAGSEGSPSVEVVARQGRAIVSLICTVARTSEILGRAFSALHAHGINVEMVSQGASKSNISLVVHDTDAGERAVRVLHEAFFGERGVAGAQKAQR